MRLALEALVRYSNRLNEALFLTIEESQRGRRAARGIDRRRVGIGAAVDRACHRRGVPDIAHVPRSRIGDRDACASPTTRPPIARSTSGYSAATSSSATTSTASSAPAPISMWSTRTPIRRSRDLRGRCSRRTPQARPPDMIDARARADRDAARHRNVHDRSGRPASGNRPANDPPPPGAMRGRPFPAWSKRCGGNSPSATSRSPTGRLPRYRRCSVSRRRADSPAGTGSASRRSHRSGARGGRTERTKIIDDGV